MMRSPVAPFLIATVFLATTPVFAQSLGSDVQEAALAPQSRIESCTSRIDVQLVDPNGTLRNCTAALEGSALSAGERAGAYLMRGRAYTLLQDADHARADNLEAVRLYSQAIDGQAPLLSLVFRRGTAYHALGDVDHALADYTYVIVSDPRNVPALVDRGILLSRVRHEMLTALADFDQAIALVPNNFELLILRGDTYAAAGKLDQALADFNRAVALQPYNAYALTHRGALYARGGVADAAIKDYTAALVIEPSDIDALVNRAALYSNGGDQRTAIADLDRALELYPKNAMALYNRGFAYYAMANYEAAIKDYSAALDVSPDLALAYNNRCLSAALAGRDKQSTLKDCDEAVARAPARPDVRETRGLVHLKYGELALAVADYDSALEIERKRPLALYGRAVALQRLGDSVRAKSDFDLARAVYPNVEREFTVFGVKF